MFDLTVLDLLGLDFSVILGSGFEGLSPFVFWAKAIFPTMTRINVASKSLRDFWLAKLMFLNLKRILFLKQAKLAKIVIGLALNLCNNWI